MARYKDPSGGSEKENVKKGKFSERQLKKETEESCRCKEVAKKTPREMLKFMIDDMAFWKKGKGQK